MNTLAETNKSYLISTLRQRYLSPTSEANDCLDNSLLASDYIGAQLHKYPELSHELTNSNLQQPIDEKWCHQHLSQRQDSETITRFLRLFRHRAMIRIIARMANGIASPSETIEETSQLAISCITYATDYLFHKMSADYGIPMNEAGEQQDFLVIAMGKLGGIELNLSSDIDLIFVYSEQGSSQGNKQLLSNHVFFTRLGQQLIHLLNDQTEDGFVFRVDMRLRPYGNSGALVASFAELKKYYREQAREWERFALARATIITGRAHFRHHLHDMIERYVYRQYIDFGVIRNLRTIKNDIRQHAIRQGNERDIKRGSGGIREIEFIAQTYQLIYGGKHTELRSASTRKVLVHIAQGNYLDATVTQQLDQSYLFLRNLENFIQARNDQQTHTLPIDTNQQQRLALAMGYSDWKQLEQQCQHHRQQIHSIFNDLILGESEQPDRQVIIDQQWITYSNALLNHQQPERNLFTDSDDQQQLDRLIIKIEKTSDDTRQLFASLLPSLFQSASQSDQPTKALYRLLNLIDNIVRRPTYLNLLLENSRIIPLLTHSMLLSDWIYQQLRQHPALLESFIHTDIVMPQPTRAQSFDKLRKALFSIAEDDEEQQIEAMRHFAREASFQVALAQTMNRLHLRKVCDWLTYTAEACIEQAFHLAWSYLTTRHGLPEKTDNTNDPEASGFAIIAYGKLGGSELNYSSDLDLVFIYTGTGTDMTDSARPISLVQFYTRLAQRIIHILTIATSAGNGYQLDTRLRPQGSKGLLVNPVHGLSDYLNNEAWTWEHQALVRARAIVGDPNTITQFSVLRQSVLTIDRNTEQLSNDVRAMRQRIDAVKKDRDIKYESGGLVDIEFLVQFLVLKHAANHPSIIKHSDNLHQIEALALAGILTTEEKRTLIHAYTELRSASHYLALSITDHNIDITEHTRKVQCIQQQWL